MFLVQLQRLDHRVGFPTVGGARFAGVLGDPVRLFPVQLQPGRRVDRFTLEHGALLQPGQHIQDAHLQVHRRVRNGGVNGGQGGGHRVARSDTLQCGPGNRVTHRFEHEPGGLATD